MAKKLKSGSIDVREEDRMLTAMMDYAEKGERMKAERVRMEFLEHFVYLIQDKV